MRDNSGWQRTATDRITAHGPARVRGEWDHIQLDLCRAWQINWIHGNHTRAVSVAWYRLSLNWRANAFNFVIKLRAIGAILIKKFIKINEIISFLEWEPQLGVHFSICFSLSLSKSHTLLPRDRMGKPPNSKIKREISFCQFSMPIPSHWFRANEKANETNSPAQINWVEITIGKALFWNWLKETNSVNWAADLDTPDRNGIGWNAEYDSVGSFQFNSFLIGAKVSHLIKNEMKTSECTRAPKEIPTINEVNNGIELFSRAHAHSISSHPIER